MDIEFVPSEEALALKELGFNEPCFGVFPEGSKLVKINGEPRNWNDNVINGETTSTPTFSQAFRWFRDKHNLHAVIMSKITPSNTTVYYIYKGKIEKDWNNCFESYEQAELDCLRKLIEIAKAQNP